MKRTPYLELLRFIFFERMLSESVERATIESIIEELKTVEDLKQILLTYGPLNTLGTTKLDFQKAEQVLVTNKAFTTDRTCVLHLVSDSFISGRKRRSERGAVIQNLAELISELEEDDAKDASNFFRQFHELDSEIADEERIRVAGEDLFLTPDEISSLLALPREDRIAAINRLEQLSARRSRYETEEEHIEETEEESPSTEFFFEKKHRNRTIEAKHEKAVSSKHYSKRSEAIRQLLRKNPQIKPRQIIDQLKSNGIEVSRDLVKRVRANWIKRKGKRGNTDLVEDFLTFSKEYSPFFQELFDSIVDVAWTAPGINLFVGQWCHLRVIRKHFSSKLFKHYSAFRSLLVLGVEDEVKADLIRGELVDLKQEIEALLAHVGLLYFFIDTRFLDLHTKVIIDDQRYERFNESMLKRLDLPCEGRDWFSELQMCFLNALHSKTSLSRIRDIQREAVLEYDRVFFDTGIRIKQKNLPKKLPRTDEIEEFEHMVLRLKY